jgi:predicted nucleotidyltransferase
MKAETLQSAAVSSLCRKHHVQTLSVFGSTARGEARPDSDIDLLVTFSKPISLLQLVILERELTTLLGRKVDLVTEASISPYLRTQILQEQRPVYAA